VLQVTAVKTVIEQRQFRYLHSISGKLQFILSSKYKQSFVSDEGDVDEQRE
jgi:hypothetical protein